MVALVGVDKMILQTLYTPGLRESRIVEGNEISICQVGQMDSSDDNSKFIYSIKCEKPSSLLPTFFFFFLFFDRQSGQ